MFKSGIFMNIDIVDRKIIAELQCNARESVSSIADSIGMSIPAVAERIKKLQDSDIIKGYQAVLNKKKVGLDVSAFITVISESSKYFEKVVSLSHETPSISKCYTTTGGGSHILLVEVENSEALEKLLRTIQSWPGVKRTETQVILSSYKDFSTTNIPNNKKEREYV
tara:strand:- start:108 stop:608 length:501 start_codon:yes stop_codon:yes gene_type:complete